MLCRDMIVFCKKYVMGILTGEICPFQITPLIKTKTNLVSIVKLSRHVIVYCFATQDISY